MSKDTNQNTLEHDHQRIQNENLSALSRRRPEQLPVARPAKIMFTGS